MGRLRRRIVQPPGLPRSPRRTRRSTTTRDPRKIVLIDGRWLTQLMIDHDIGVATARSLVVKKIDQDYFEEDSG